MNLSFKCIQIILMASLVFGGYPRRLFGASSGDPQKPADRAVDVVASESDTEQAVSESASAKSVASPSPEVPDDDDVSEWARKYETLEREMRDMQALFAAGHLKIQESAPTARSGGLLTELERKALAYDAIQGQIEYKDAMIATFQAERDKARTIIAAQRKEIQALTETIAGQDSNRAVLAKENENLKKSLDLLRLGQYEYYEIKEGDTVESIAAKPSIYGDASRHIVIRQANRGHVENIDRLLPGEVIIIPRFPASGRYEF